MQEAIRQADRWKKSSPARPDFAKKFTPETITRQYLEMYTGKSGTSPQQ
jgi:hypothetical protein